MTDLLYLVSLEGPPSLYNHGENETMGVWVVAASYADAMAKGLARPQFTEKVRLNWRAVHASAHGEPRDPGLVTYRVDEPTPGIKFERLEAFPWPEDAAMGRGAVTATKKTSGYDVSWDCRGHASADDARRLAHSLVAVVDEADARGW